MKLRFGVLATSVVPLAILANLSLVVGLARAKEPRAVQADVGRVAKAKSLAFESRTLAAAMEDPACGDHPLESVCAEMSNPPDTAAEVAREMGPLPELTESAPVYRARMKKLYQMTLKRLVEIGGPEEAEIVAHLKHLRRITAANLKSGVFGPSAEVPDSDADLAERVLDIQFVFWPKSAWQDEAFLKYCGRDGLTSGAAYLGTERTYMMCPGFLLDVLDAGTLDAFDLVVAHELAHSFASAVSPELRDKYFPFLACMNENHALGADYEKEMTSDLGAEKALVSRLSELSPGAARARAFRSSVRQLCERRTGKHSEHHPSNEFRMLNLLRAPRIRQLLGCQRLTTAQVSCDQGSELIARCGKAAGLGSRFKNAEDCERAFIVDLKASGCAYTGASCRSLSAEEGIVCSARSHDCRLPQWTGGSVNGGLSCAYSGKRESLRLIDALLPGVCRVHSIEVNAVDSP